jgi:predicted nucleic-acid-binding Zn-ribbon protein
MRLFGKKEPETVEVFGKALHCQVCGNSTFWRRRALLHATVATFFNVEWASPSCICVICSACGYVHWFFPQK